MARTRPGELFEQLAVARNVRVAERDGVVGRRSGVLAPVGIRRGGASVGEAARVGEEIAPFDPQFERVVVVLAVPLLGGTVGGVLQHHHHIGGRPARAHHVITAVGEGLDLGFGHRALGAARRHPQHLLIVGEEVIVVGEIASKYTGSPRGTARVGHVGHRIVGIDHVHHHVGHLAHRLDVILREAALLAVALRHLQRNPEILDARDVVVQVAVHQPAVGEILRRHLTAQHARTALLPGRSVLQLGEQHAGECHGLSLGDQMVGGRRIVIHDVVGVLVEMCQHLGQPLDRNGGRLLVVLQQGALVDQAGSHVERTPRSVIGHVGPLLGLGILFQPVAVDLDPVQRVFLIRRGVVGLGLRNHPLVAVELITLLLLPRGPDRPVDARALGIQVGIRHVGLTGIGIEVVVDIETVIVLAERVIGPALLVGRGRHARKIDIGIQPVRTRTVVVHQLLQRHVVVADVVSALHFRQTAVIEIQHLEHAGVDAFVHRPRAALDPLFGPLHLGENRTGAEHGVRLRSLRIDILRIVRPDMLGLLGEIRQELRKQLRRERGRLHEIIEQIALGLDTAGHIGRAPGIQCLARLLGLRGGIGVVVHVARRTGIFPQPVLVDRHPFGGIGLVERRTVSLSLRDHPLMAVYAVALFQIARRANGPVNGPGFQVGIRHVAVHVTLNVKTILVGEERLIGPHLFLGGDRGCDQVDVAVDHVGPATVVFQQSLRRQVVLVGLVVSLHGGKTGIIEVQSAEHARFDHAVVGNRRLRGTRSAAVVRSSQIIRQTARREQDCHDESERRNFSKNAFHRL